jgi:hypothetical protein
MPRDHARVKTNIWKDPDFIALPALAQRAYFLLTSQAKLSYCGVMDWWPGRWAGLAKDTSEMEFIDHVGTLIEARFVILDPGTSEVLIRTYVRHDGILDRPNMGKACIVALEQVSSINLTEDVYLELARMYSEDPELGGFKGIEQRYPDQFKRIVSKAHTLPGME